MADCVGLVDDFDLVVDLCAVWLDLCLCGVER